MDGVTNLVHVSTFQVHDVWTTEGATVMRTGLPARSVLINVHETYLQNCEDQGDDFDEDYVDRFNSLDLNKAEHKRILIGHMFEAGVISELRMHDWLGNDGAVAALGGVPEGEAAKKRRSQTDIDKAAPDAFLYPIGIEMTMMPPESTKDFDPSDLYARLVNTYLGKRRIPHAQCSDDQYCVEVNSPVFYALSRICGWYEKVAEVMLMLGLEPKVESMTCGGGHIHVGPLPIRTATALMRDVQNRPWIGWLFNEPDDAVTANTFTKKIQNIDAKVLECLAKVNVDLSPLLGSLSESTQDALTFFSQFPSTQWGGLPDEKSGVLRCKHQGSGKWTVEFRCFEAPLDLAEQKAQLLFTDKYVRHVEAASKDVLPVVTIKKFDDLKKYDYHRARAEAVEFITSLGLDIGMYGRMLDENLRIKFSRGSIDGYWQPKQVIADTAPDAVPGAASTLAA